MTKEKMSNVLYGTWKEIGTDDAYFLAMPKVEDLDVIESEVNVGIYELKKVVKVINKTTIKE